MKVTENQLLKYGQNETRDKRAADNGRFGVMAAVTPQKRQCKFARKYPAGSVVGAATTPSRWNVGCNRANDSAVVDGSNELDNEFIRQQPSSKDN